mgnify:CR=1 FL=1
MEGQSSTIKVFCKDHNWELDREFEDEAISGGELKRE